MIKDDIQFPLEVIQTLILKALLKPLAKNPPNGAIMDANKPRHKACHCTGSIDISFRGNCNISLNDNEYVSSVSNRAISSKM